MSIKRSERIRVTGVLGKVNNLLAVCLTKSVLFNILSLPPMIHQPQITQLVMSIVKEKGLSTLVYSGVNSLSQKNLKCNEAQ